MPHAFELPGVLRSIVPLVSAGYSIINEFIAFGLRHSFRAFQFFWIAPWCLPCFSAVARALDDLSEPGAGLRSVNPVRVDRGTLHVINLPAREMRPVHFPVFALRVRCKHKRAFFCSDQHSYSAHD